MGTRINAQGRPVPSNFLAYQESESLQRCGGCGRTFSAYDMACYSRAVDGNRVNALNRARAVRHADACKGKDV